jgi:hypothetical protein
MTADVSLKLLLQPAALAASACSSCLGYEGHDSVVSAGRGYLVRLHGTKRAGFMPGSVDPKAVLNNLIAAFEGEQALLTFGTWWAATCMKQMTNAAMMCRLCETCSPLTRRGHWC